MSGKYQKLNWQEKINRVTIDCSLDIAIHSADNGLILLTIPGVDGSVDGYEKKYVKIAEDIHDNYGVAVVRMSNPFVSSLLWESNVRQVLQFIEDNAELISGRDDIELRVMAHSAGAAIIAQIAWEYPFISKLLLINPAIRMWPDKIKHGLVEIGCDKVTILIGDRDPSLIDVKRLSNIKSVVVNGADHDFSGDAFLVFLSSAGKYLFDKF
jgi:pimeloyl-ACP methyl ester carboxylesterase